MSNSSGATASKPEPILTTRNLVKRYGRVTALDHADFDLYPGEILAVIGDNGAGKSTLIKAICGAVTPDEGEIRLEGKTAIYLEREMREQQQVLNGKFAKTQETKCSAPGEIGKEYKEYLRREEERIRLEKENEETLSSQLIQQVIVSL